MAQKQDRRQGNGLAHARGGRGGPGRGRQSAEVSGILRGITATLLMAALLCGAASAQIPGSPDVPEPSRERVSKGRKGRHAKRRPRPKLARANSKRRPPTANLSSSGRPKRGRLAGKPNNGSQAANQPAAAATAKPRETTQDNGSIGLPLTVGGAPDTSPAGKLLWMRGVAEEDPFKRIENKNRVFVQTFNNPKAHNIIVKELGKYPKLTLVATREEADFIVSYTDKHGFDAVPGASSSPGRAAVPTPILKLIGEMVVYTLGEKRADGQYEIHVVWSDPEDQDKPWLLPVNRHPATNLTRNFLKALKRSRGESK